MNAGSLLASAALLFAVTTVVSFEAADPVWGQNQKTVSDTGTPGNSSSASSKSVNSNANDSQSSAKSNSAKKKNIQLERCMQETPKGPFDGPYGGVQPDYQHADENRPGKDNNAQSAQTYHQVNGDGAGPFKCGAAKSKPSW